MKADSFLKLLAAVLLVAGTSGCAVKRFLSHQLLQGDYSVYSFDGELQNTYVKKSGKGYRVCAGPTPDAVRTKTEGVEVEIPHSGEDVGAENSSGAVALGGRDPEVLIARELMYRACELSLNHDASYKQARDIYTETLTAIQAIAQYQNITGTQAIVANAVNPNLPTHQQPAQSDDSDDDSDDSDSSDDSSDDSDYSDDDSDDSDSSDDSSDDSDSSDDTSSDTDDTDSSSEDSDSGSSAGSDSGDTSTDSSDDTDYSDDDSDS